MSLKIFLFLLGLITLSCVIEAKHLRKKLHGKKQLSQSDETFKTLLRKRRDTENATENSNEEVESAVTNFLDIVVWEAHKLEMISGFLEGMADSDKNMTLMGWQRIYDDKGHIKEIKTIQLVIPPKPDSKLRTNIVDDDDDMDDDDFFHEVRKLKQVFTPEAGLDISGSATTEMYNKDGEKKILMYADKDELYAKRNNFAKYDKTKIAPLEEVENFVTNLKPTFFGEPSVAKYDVDGKYISSPNTNNIPYFLGRVLDHHEATDKMILEGPEIITKISLKYPKDEIPKQLAAAYNKFYPNYKWRVLVNPNNYYLIKDVFVELTYDTFDFDESDISYLVYGSKNE